MPLSLAPWKYICSRKFLITAMVSLHVNLMTMRFCNISSIMSDCITCRCIAELKSFIPKLCIEPSFNVLTLFHATGQRTNRDRRCQAQFIDVRGSQALSLQLIIWYQLPSCQHECRHLQTINKQDWSHTHMLLRSTRYHIPISDATNNQNVGHEQHF